MGDISRWIHNLDKNWVGLGRVRPFLISKIGIFQDRGAKVICPQFSRLKLGKLETFLEFWESIAKKMFSNLKPKRRGKSRTT